jgi:hypothetical protein
VTAQSDCSKAQSPERCGATRKAYESCKEKFGPALRQCMQEQAPGRPAPKDGAPGSKP